MPKKIGRNDPCPCGSGKKNKHCCLVKDRSSTGETTPKPEELPISRLALMRFMKELIDNPEELEIISRELKKHGQEKSFRDFILGSWNIKKVRKMSTLEIIEKLESMNINFDVESFKKQAQNYVSAIQLAEDHYYMQNIHASDNDEDFIWLAIIELWNRIVPEICNIEMIDDSMQEGYEDIKNRNYGAGIEKWGKAWNMIVSIVPTNIKSVTAADEFFLQLTQSIFNWCQDFEVELRNAGLKDDTYYTKRIKYCQSFSRIFPNSDELIMPNMLRGEAESYAALGDVETAEKLFNGLIERFPGNVWGYIGWGDMYCGLHNSKTPINYDEAEKIYRLGLARCNTESDVISERLGYLRRARKKSHVKT